MSTQVIHSENASKRIGIYSQAIKTGQIPLEQITMEVLRGNFLDQAQAVFENLWDTIRETGGSLEDVVNPTVFLTDLNPFEFVNGAMDVYFSTPYPARPVAGVASLLKTAPIDVRCDCMSRRLSIRYGG